MEKYYFTFGSQHRNKSGKNLKNHFVQVSSEDREGAMSKFYSWAKENLPHPSQWATCLTERQFVPSFFKGGAIEAI